MKVLRAIKGRLLLGQLTRRPQLEKRMVLAVIFVARRDQLIMKRLVHGLLSILRTMTYPTDDQVVAKDG